MKVPTFHVGEEPWHGEELTDDCGGFASAGFNRNHLNALFGHMGMAMQKFAQSDGMSARLMQNFPKKIPVYLRTLVEQELSDDQIVTMPLDLAEDDDPPQFVIAVEMQLRQRTLTHAMEAFRNSLIYTLTDIVIDKAVNKANKSRYKAWKYGISNHLMACWPKDIWTPYAGTTSGLSVSDRCETILEDVYVDTLCEASAQSVFRQVSLEQLWRACSELTDIFDKSDGLPDVEETDAIMPKVFGGEAANILSNPAFRKALPGTQMIVLTSRTTSSALLTLCDIGEEEENDEDEPPMMMRMKGHESSWAEESLDEKGQRTSYMPFYKQERIAKMPMIQFEIDPEDDRTSPFSSIRCNGHKVVFDKNFSGKLPPKSS